MPHKLELTLLSTLDIRLEGKPVANLRSIKAQALLCYLAVTGRMHSRSALSGLLWGDTPEEQARASLRQALSTLTELCDGCLTVTRQTIAFDRTHPYSLDTELFEAAATRVAVIPGLVECYADLDLYRGDFLEGFYVRNAPDYENWMLGVRARYRELALQAFYAVAVHQMESGDMARAIFYNRRLLEIEPWHEGAHRQLMKCLVQTEQRSAALEQYRLCRQLLADELGVEPDEATQTLYRAIKFNQLTTTLRDGDPHAAASMRQLEPQPAMPPRSLNLPKSLSPFIGRDREIAAIQQRLTAPQCRLLTLIGPGGIGKTRLAIEVARTARQTYNDGVFFVNLQPTTTPEALPVAIADALHIVLAIAEPPHQQLQQYLADKTLLLVLDNFEHLLEGAPLLAELLAAAPNVQLLVTSREVLNLREEWLFWVEGIACPPLLSRLNEEELESYGAVQIFREHAQRLQPTFALESNEAAVVRICQLSGGMPLALELAASWVKSLSCTEIAEELATGLAILSTPLRNIPERHRTMHVVFEQSWRRLSEHEQAVFQKLSSFRGGFRREAAYQVASATWQELAVLVDRSLLKLDAEGRYQIHELLRQYGQERLAESFSLEIATYESYSAYFMEFLAKRRFEFDGKDQFQAVQEIADELENIRSAWQWAINHLQAETIRPALRSLFFFLQHRGRYLEGAETFADAVGHLESRELQGTQSAALAECLTYYGWFCIRLGWLAEANTALARARHLYDSFDIPPPQYRAGNPIAALMILALVQGDYDQALTWGEQARFQAEQHSQPAALAFAYSGLASTLLAQGKYAQAWAYAEQGLAINNTIGNRWLLCYCHDILGQIAYVQEKLPIAKHHFEAAYAIREESEEPGGMAETLNHLGEVALAGNEPVMAQQHYERSLVLSREVNDHGSRATATKGLGDVAHCQGHYLLAEKHYQQALQMALESHYTPLIFKLLLASANLFLQTDRWLLAVELFAFVYQHPASDFTCKEQAHQALEHLGEYPIPALQGITWQAASLEWATILSSVQTHLYTTT